MQGDLCFHPLMTVSKQQSSLFTANNYLPKLRLVWTLKHHAQWLRAVLTDRDLGMYTPFESS